MTENEAIQYYTELHFQYAAFQNAAIRAAKQAREHEPKGFWQRMAAGALISQFGTYEHAVWSQAQVQDSLPKHARIGATAYVRREQGNYYTYFLYQNFGPYI